MKQALAAVALCGLLGGMSGAVCAQTALKIGVINYAQLVDDSPQAKVVKQQLQSEFAPKQRELVTQQNELKGRQEKFERDAATMSESERSKAEKSLRDGLRDLQRKQGEFQDDVNARQNEEIGRLQKTVVQEVQAYAKTQGFDLVIAEGVIYAKDSLNITQALLDVLKAKSAKPAAAPAAKP